MKSRKKSQNETILPQIFFKNKSYHILKNTHCHIMETWQKNWNNVPLSNKSINTMHFIEKCTFRQTLKKD
jgi:hypothetical protein